MGAEALRLARPGGRVSPAEAGEDEAEAAAAAQTGAESGGEAAISVRLRPSCRFTADKASAARTAPNEPKTPYAPLDAGRRERELIPENGPTPDVVVGRSALGNAAASRVNEMPRRARRAKVNANVVLSTDENFSPFWDPTCRSRSGRVIQYGAKKNWSLVLRS